MESSSPKKPRSTDALRRARARLSHWKSRVVDAHNLRRDLDAEVQAHAAHFVQELQDRCDRAETTLLGLQVLENAWARARADLDQDLARIELAWESFARSLSPARG